MKTPDVDSGKPKEQAPREEFVPEMILWKIEDLPPELLQMIYSGLIPFISDQESYQLLQAVIDIPVPWGTTQQSLVDLMINGVPLSAPSLSLVNRTRVSIFTTQVNHEGKTHLLICLKVQRNEDDPMAKLTYQNILELLTSLQSNIPDALRTIAEIDGRNNVVINTHGDGRPVDIKKAS